MTRDIKFRAWDKDGCRMMSWETLEKTNAQWFKSLIINGREDTDLMQYTGLLDRHGKEIYEGDILLVPDEYKEIVCEGRGPMYPDNHLAPVVFSEGSFGVDFRESDYFLKAGFMSFPMIAGEMGDDFTTTECEVIGNIWESPELLEVK